MDILQLMKERHSVRQYKDQPITPELRSTLTESISELNQESGLHMQVFFDEPDCFDSFMAHYGKFKGVSNYIAIVGSRQDQEKAGYYGEKLVLECQSLGLNTCWVAMTHGKTKAKIEKGQKLLIVLSLGYGANPGVPHKSKGLSELSKADQDTDWFLKGMEAVSLAPTAMNQQKFLFELKNGKVTAKALNGFYSKIDLGIVKYHFEAATGHKVL
ncbi:nitroreductase family protein [Blautia sp. HCP3S3_H10_1]|uniref:nitroreductase family protein n=1 Tax=unclassified Blautia TaxID=2648079 RepID=UPI003F916494|nr:nitroreductase family protein [Clostridia bacterium]